MDSKDRKTAAALDTSQQTLEGKGDTFAGVLNDKASSSRRTPSRSTSPRLTRSATTPVISTTQNLSASPLPSREVSPIRPSQPAPKYSTARVSRSRKNSSDQSPQRTSPSHTPTAATQTVPSAAAVQRALAAVGDKKLPSPTTANFSADSLEPRKSARGIGSTAAAQARLTSPPVSKTKTPGTRAPEPQPAALGNHGTSKPATGIETIEEEDDSESVAADSRYPGRGSVGGKLETVQEDSPVTTPAMSDSAFQAQRPTTIQEDPDEDNPDMASSQTTAGTRSSATTGENGSGSDEIAASKKNKGKEQQKGKEPDKPVETKTAPSTAPASRKPSITQLAPKPSIQPRRSFQHLNPARNKEGSVKSMTVETETVSNPELLGAVGDREGRSASGTTGSVRTKASTETIRPKREKKRVRKAPSIANGPSKLLFFNCAAADFHLNL